jgi:hypothetical protein
VNARDFSRRRELIERNDKRGSAWKKRATLRLAAEAGALTITAGGRILGYRLKDGSGVCVKRRYHSSDAAAVALSSINATDGTQTKPIRSYACRCCLGWHLTSEYYREV